MSWSHLIIIVRITWSLATIYLKPKYAAWPQAISSNSLQHGRLPKTISTQALFLDFGLLGVCHMAACHNPSQTIVCCLAACRNPSAPRVCRMAACCNPSAPRVCHMAACHLPPLKLEVGTILCLKDACHFPSYRNWLWCKDVSSLKNHSKTRGGHGCQWICKRGCHKVCIWQKVRKISQKKDILKLYIGFILIFIK